MRSRLEVMRDARATVAKLNELAHELRDLDDLDRRRGAADAALDALGAENMLGFADTVALAAIAFGDGHGLACGKAVM